MVKGWERGLGESATPLPRPALPKPGDGCEDHRGWLFCRDGRPKPIAFPPPPGKGLPIPRPGPEGSPGSPGASLTRRRSPLAAYSEGGRPECGTPERAGPERRAEGGAGESASSERRAEGGAGETASSERRAEGGAAHRAHRSPSHTAHGGRSAPHTTYTTPRRCGDQPEAGQHQRSDYCINPDIPFLGHLSYLHPNLPRGKSALAAQDRGCHLHATPRASGKTRGGGFLEYR